MSHVNLVMALLTVRLICVAQRLSIRVWNPRLYSSVRLKLFLLCCMIICNKIKLSLSPCCNSIDKHLYIFFRKQMFSSLKWMNLSSQISSQVLMKLKRNSQVMPSEISHLSLSLSLNQRVVILIHK